MIYNWCKCSIHEWFYNHFPCKSFPFTLLSCFSWWCFLFKKSPHPSENLILQTCMFSFPYVMQYAEHDVQQLYPARDIVPRLLGMAQRNSSVGVFLCFPPPFLKGRQICWFIKTIIFTPRKGILFQMFLPQVFTTGWKLGLTILSPKVNVLHGAQVWWNGAQIFS